MGTILYSSSSGPWRRRGSSIGRSTRVQRSRRIRRRIHTRSRHMCPILPSLSLITILLVTKKTQKIPKPKKKKQNNNNQNLKSQITTINNKQKKIKLQTKPKKKKNKKNKKVKTKTLETKMETLEREMTGESLRNCRTEKGRARRRPYRTGLRSSAADWSWRIAYLFSYTASFQSSPTCLIDCRT